MTGPATAGQVAKGSEDALVTTKRGSSTLSVVPPFDFAKSLEFLELFTPAQGEQTIAGQALVKALCIGGRTVACNITSSGTVGAPRLSYTIVADRPIEETLRAAVEDRVAFFLSLHDDLRPFYQLGQADQHFAPVIARLYGLHQVKFLTPFENASWAVLTQRNPMSIARRMKQALTERYGGGIVVDGVTHWAFPEAATLAAADPADLLALLHNAQRADYLHAVATAFASTDEAWLRSAPWEEVNAWLRSIKGIGAWSASFILLRGLGRMEQVALHEARLNDAAGRMYGLGRPATDAELAQLAAPYGPWQGYWSHYLRIAG